MTRKKAIEEKLHAAKASVGDTIRITRGTEKTEGILMPHHEFSGDDIITVKLKNGYNVSVAVDEKASIEVTKKHTIAEKKEKTIPFDEKKPTISVLGTGGTIACYVEYRTGAVYPATSSEDLAFSVPEMFDICNVNARVVFQLFSENIEVSHWQTLAKEIAKELNNGAAGVVIPHGTDTIGYTAAALSFMLKNLSGPVVLVGAQRSSDRPSSDAAQNLLAAARVAATSDIGEVVVVMHGESSDTFSVIHRGTKVRKFHSSQRDAFKTVNDTPLGKVENGAVVLSKEYRKKTKGKVVVDDGMDEDVAMVYSHIGLKPEAIPDKKGIILIGTGLGHVPLKVIPRITQLTKKGSTIVMTSQCFFGRVNMNVYSAGRDLLQAGVISGEDMLPETAFVKLMWVLAHGKNQQDVVRLMGTNISGEMTESTKWNTSL